MKARSRRFRFGKPRLGKRPRGMALVIVLAFMVILLALIMAFFSQSALQRQVSQASSNQVNTDMLAHSLIDLTVGSFQQEMYDQIGAGGTSSNAGFLNPTNNVTFYRQDSSQPPKFPNVVLESGENSSFFSFVGGPSLAIPALATAAGGSTVTPSANGRSISAARWNKPLFLPVTATTDLTPPNFTAPNWILVDRNGPVTNPAWSPNMRATTDLSSSTAVIGRYAFVVYDEGGLLDVNVAGFPNVQGGAFPGRFTFKDSLAFADLTQAHSLGVTGLTQKQVNALVGWRNQGTLNVADPFSYIPTTSDMTNAFLKWATQNPNGFIRPAPITNGSAFTDHIFTSRQQLISFLTSTNFVNINKDGGLTTIQDALQYLTTFSRDLDQPGYWMDGGRRPILSPSGTMAADYRGGNDQSGTPITAINPSPLTIQAGSFVRNDGSKAGNSPEPVMAKRFPLSRLSWLTHAGPSHDVAVTDQAITSLKNQWGVSQDYLNEGTPGLTGNIYKYFGLAWSSGNNFWLYNHSPGSPNIGRILTLAEVASQGREPDFFELLKAGLNVGSLGKAAAINFAINDQADPYQQADDVSVDHQILQIGANIIDQAQPDRVPTQINFADSSGKTTTFYGVDDVPYMESIVTFPIQLVPPNPRPTETEHRPYFTNKAITNSQEMGVGALIAEPVMWDPYEYNPNDDPNMLPSGSPYSYFITIKPNAYQGGGSFSSGTSIRITAYPMTNSYSEAFTASDTSHAISPSQTYAMSAANSEIGMTIKRSTSGSINITNEMREPTLLRTAGQAQGQPHFTKLWTSSTMSIRSGTTTIDYTLAAPTNTTVASAGFPDNYSGNQVQNVLGAVVGLFPLRWSEGSNNNYTNYTTIRVTIPPTSVRYSLSPDSSNSEYASSIQAGAFQYGGFDQGLSGTANYVWSSGVNGHHIFQSAYSDPRTSRFGMASTTSDGSDYFVRSLQSDGTVTLPTDSSEHFSQDTPGSGIGGGNAAQAGWKNSAPFIHSAMQANTTNSVSGYFTDPDGVVRPGMAAYAAGSVGYPYIAGHQSRPVMLHRPLRSVAELGYVFSDTPWRNLDFFTPNSGAASLLDYFCVNENESNASLNAGKVSLNTQQAPVVNAILYGAYRDALESESGSIVTDALGATSTESSGIASNLTAWTSGTGGPMGNTPQLVQQYDPANSTYKSWISQVAAGDKNLYTGGVGSAANIVQRFVEAAVRPLANNMTGRTWNFMIDLVTQTGRFPANATGFTTAGGASSFLVEGEQRYWVHVSLDRLTGKILDMQVESVKE